MNMSCHSLWRSDLSFFFMYDGSFQTCAAPRTCYKASPQMYHVMLSFDFCFLCCSCKALGGLVISKNLLQFFTVVSKILLGVDDDLLQLLRALTPGSEGVFACCHYIVLVTLMGPQCKGIRDWFALPLSGHWAIQNLGSVQSAERMQSDLHLLDIRIPEGHKDS